MTHEPVMVREVLAALAVQPGGRYIDCTLGAGGHAEAVLEAASPGGTLLGIDKGPATKTFQALRIAVNQELASLVDALPRALGLLGFGSRLAVISYHSLEDRIVKQFIARESKDCICPPKQPICTCGHVRSLRAVTRGAVSPSSEEVRSNPRSRSA